MAKLSKHPKGSIALTFDSTFSTPEHKNGKHANYFQICAHDQASTRAPGQGGRASIRVTRTYELRADSAEELQEWRQAVEFSAAQLRVRGAAPAK